MDSSKIYYNIIILLDKIKDIFSNTRDIRVLKI
jgi:hypothetical protein